MDSLSRREFIQTALALGATAVVAGVTAKPSLVTWHERRDLFPEGVASGDPHSDGVLLWTRYPSAHGTNAKLTVEVAQDREFRKVVATTTTMVSAASDWTCRVLVGGLEPVHEYWYRFTDAHGSGSHVGRTLTAPAENDPRPVKFAFVSCPVERIERPDGGPLSYRVVHRAQLWSKGERPRLEQTVLEGNPEFSL
jgi:alkaline phosphatase D